MTHWPELSYARWAPTGKNLHMWLQIVGKSRLAWTPWLNHSWHAAFYITGRGLTTSLIPADPHSYEVVFDFIDQQLMIVVTDGQQASIPLKAMSVAQFYERFFDTLSMLGLATAIHDTPNEVADPVPFHQQTEPGAYDPVAARQFWQALVAMERMFTAFRSGYIGKVSPVHLFWGSFDLAVTRFSGRTAPLHPGGIPALPDTVTQEAYSHEVSSAGFWPGGSGAEYAFFYSYAYPTPDGFANAHVEPAEAFYHETMGEFILPYEAVRSAADPDATLLRFLNTTYEAAASLGQWPREELECVPGQPRIPRPIAS
ncbi:MAG: hypothetical protein HC837_16770 [Chloroflexaceae bacterium]|nr:hypothetical protein [Chloroflexaceae bacterium]